MSIATDLEPRNAARPAARPRSSLTAILADHGVTLLPQRRAQSAPPFCCSASPACGR